MKTRLVLYAIWIFITFLLFGCYYVEDVPKPTFEACETWACNQMEECYRCQALSGGNPDYCENSGSMKSKCYYDAAIKKNEPSICERAEEKRETCYNDIAMMTYNEELCEKAGMQKSFCKRNVQQVKDNLDFCTRLRGSEITCKEDSLLQTVQMPDESMCSNISAIKKHCVETGLKRIIR
jgi:hypothetical protein